MSERIIPFNQLKKANYNRPISRAQVNKIKRDFHEDMVQLAIVSFRDNAYYIIDHQHQSQAIYELNDCDPNTSIKCDVRTGLTYEQEADLYYRLNTGSRVLDFTAKIIGQIEAKDEVALAFRDIVEGSGYVVGGDTNKSLKAVKTAWNIFNRTGGKDALTDVLSLVHATWPNMRRSATAEIISAVDMFLLYHKDEYAEQQFVKNLSFVMPSEVAEKGDTYYKKMNSKSFTKQYCTYTELVEFYNKGLRSRKLKVVPPTSEADA